MQKRPADVMPAGRSFSRFSDQAYHQPISAPRCVTTGAASSAPTATSSARSGRQRRSSRNSKPDGALIRPHVRGELLDYIFLDSMVYNDRITTSV
jgi:hypothetical protein